MMIYCTTAIIYVQVNKALNVSIFSLVCQLMHVCGCLQQCFLCTTVSRLHPCCSSAEEGTGNGSASAFKLNRLLDCYGQVAPWTGDVHQQESTLHPVCGLQVLVGSNRQSHLYIVCDCAIAKHFSIGLMWHGTDIFNSLLTTPMASMGELYTVSHVFSTLTRCRLQKSTCKAYMHVNTWSKVHVKTCVGSLGLAEFCLSEDICRYCCTWRGVNCP